MKRKFVWLVVSSLMVLSLILASCAPAAPTTPVVPTTPAVPTTPTAPAAPVAPTKPTPPAPVVTTEVPKYGGVFTFSVTSEQPTFDDAYRGRASTRTNAQTNMSLTTGDWSLGAAGTGAIDYWTWTAISTAQTGEITESWEFLSDSEAVFHIRKGIYWGLDPNNAMSKLVGGRELNAYDVEFTLKRTFDQLPGYPEPKAYTYSRLTKPEHPTSIQATDKWTVVLKGNSGYFGSTFKWVSQSIGMIAPEVIKAGKNFTDPKNYVSNGPFMLTDYVAGASITFARNANYWRKDPVGPGKGNQLPYLDGVKMLVIPDRSTVMSALRTAKIDYAWQLTREENADLKKSTPQLQRALIPGNAEAIAMRVDKPAQPWSNLKVRQALQLGLDRQAIVKDYYGGEAAIYAFPSGPYPQYVSSGGHVPFDKLPKSVQELFEYNPTKAKQLLAEAGYPNGFKMEVIIESAMIDKVSIMKDQLAKIGVDLQLAVKERGVYTSIGTGRTHNEGYFEGVDGAPYAWHQLRPDDPANASMVDDPVINKAIADFAKYFMFDDGKAFPIIGEVTPHILEQAWYLQFPMPYVYTLWWPWVKNFHGEWAVGATDSYGFTKYIWFDKALKKSMGF